MATPTSPANYALPEAVSNTPVEIWQEIINYTLFDPVIFSTDPFYPGCNYHTALNEWHDIRRLRNHEVQRGLLRLVSRSWRTLADYSPWQFFEPLRCEYDEQRRSQAHYARRLQVPFVDHRCNDIWAGGDAHCLCCYGHRGYRANYIARTIVTINGPPIKAEILRLPLWAITPADEIASQKLCYDSLPNLRALFAGISDLPTSTFVDALANITLLGLRVLDQSTWKDVDALPCVFPSVSTFQILSSDSCSYNFIAKWEMPRLIHLDATGSGGAFHWRDSLYQFIETNGINLVSLRLRCLHDLIVLPNNLWSMLPMLNYFGASVIDTPYQGPPSNHHLHTFAILEDNKNVLDARNDACYMMESNNVTTIADCHDWNNMPDEFSQFVGQERCRPDRYHLHPDRAQFCWMCVVPLYLTCTQRGLRYEDRNGRTFGEYQAQ